MSAWRRVALEILPEFRREIQEANGPMAMWVEFNLPFKRAVEANSDDLIRRFFAYAAWCMDTAQDRTTDASTAAWCAFYEHIPNVPTLAGKLHRYLPKARFDSVKDAFRPRITDAGFAQ